MALRSRRKEVEELDAGSDESRFASVLVVHDDPDGCELLSRVIERGAGLMVQRAHDSREMADALRHRPACVVLDVSAGGVGGNLKLLDAVRNNPDPAVTGARVILIAASSSNEMFSWQAGIDGFLKRPFHADELVAAVRDALARPDDERSAHRREMIELIANGKRTTP